MAEIASAADVARLPVGRTIVFVAKGQTFRFARTEQGWAEQGAPDPRDPIDDNEMFATISRAYARKRPDARAS